MSIIAEQVAKSGRTTSDVSVAAQIPENRLLEMMRGAEPTLEELRKLASAIGISLSDFLPRTEDEGRAALLFRQTMGQLKQSLIPAVDRLSRQMDYYLEFVSSPDRPFWVNVFSGPHETYLQAETSAETFRNLFFRGDHVSPIQRLPQIVQEMGVLMLVVPKLRIDGASALINSVPFIFIAPRFPPRMLFTLAHEVGHLVAHHGPDQDFAIIDDVNETELIRPGRNLRERYADAFASCLLLPRAGVGLTLRKVREIYKSPEDAPVGDIEILYLANIFGVSFQAAAKRCEDMYLLPRGGALSLYEKLCKEYESPEKRARELNLPPREEIEFPSVPPRLLEAALNKIRRGEVSVGKASSTLNLSISSLMEINSRLQP